MGSARADLGNDVPSSASESEAATKEPLRRQQERDEGRRGHGENQDDAIDESAEEELEHRHKPALAIDAPNREKDLDDNRDRHQPRDPPAQHGNSPIRGHD